MNRQFFSLLATRTRRLSITQAPPIGKKETRNIYIIPAILFAIVITFICEPPASLLTQFWREMD